MSSISCTNLDNGLSNLSSSNDNNTNYIASPVEGLKITKCISACPIIYNHDILLMVDDIPCTSTNLNKIETIINNSFYKIEHISLLRLFTNLNRTANDNARFHSDSIGNLEGVTNPVRLPISNSVSSPLDVESYKNEKLCHTNHPINNLLRKKKSNNHISTQSSSLPLATDPTCLRKNNSDFNIYSQSNPINPFKNKRFSYFKFVDKTVPYPGNPLHRSQSQSLSSPKNQVFTENDLVFQKIIGEGFFGKAIKVINKQTHEEYAMKILKVINNLTLNNFRKEVQLMKSLTHPNLVKFIGVFLTREGINVLMEYIGGGTLKKYIKTIRKNIKPMFTPTQIYSIVLDISSGMAYLHSKNIAHRDLTSSNCLLRDHQNLHVVISDFGLSEVIIQKHKKLAVVGSPYWMAPEMLNGKMYDTNVDIFSFGIIVCEITTLLDANPDYLKRNMDFGLDIESYLKCVHPTVPDTLSNLAIRCCNLDPKKRPPFSTIYNIMGMAYDKCVQKIHLKE